MSLIETSKHEQELSSHREKTYPLLLNALHRVITLCTENDRLQKVRNLKNNLKTRLNVIVEPNNYKPGTSQKECNAIRYLPQPGWLYKGKEI